ncbi:ABC transporter transmembrane domain-containing protein [Poritiphilus flavus]|uniref:ATP-binding cassette domain-containing protein n=1 Tax=Poritiphilus flavus TaxID=2697053 RepID=A0A6L9EBB2_9FLAO|nr:ABC transporter ATP-binding protein [Poritiphilus flavus]NAS11861.1 ATP-binding cassette domain-containing protein [Poritiphilus flavus]
MRTTKWRLIKGFAKGQKALLTITLLLGFTYNLFTILIPISIGKFYEFAFGFSSHRLKAFGFIPFMDTEDHISFLVVFFTLVIFRFGFEYGNRYGMSLVGERFVKSLRERLFDCQMQIALPVYSEKGIGKYLLRFSGDLKSIQNYLKQGLMRFVQDVTLLSIVFMVITAIDALMALLILGVLVLASFILWLINKVIYKQSLERRNLRSGMLSFVNTRLRAMISLKAFNKNTPENKRYHKRSTSLYQIGRKYANTLALMQASVPAITYTLLGVIMVYVLNSPTYQKNHGGSTLLVVILLILSILPVLRRVLRVSIVWKLGNISFDKLIQVFELPKENELPFQELSREKDPIIFENVQFSYNNAPKSVFRNLNLVIQPGNTTLLFGPSGCGKSTIIKLLLKTVSPGKGRLKIGEIPYTVLSEKAIRKRIAVVSNDYPLYGRDVYEAIVYSRSKERKIRASKLLAYMQYFENPKDHLQLHDRIGDLGSNLNSGQSKLLQYCRAFLTDKPILIIEEPFKSLSCRTRSRVLDKLKDLQNEKTIILISHSQKTQLKTDQTINLAAQVQ